MGWQLAMQELRKFRMDADSTFSEVIFAGKNPQHDASFLTIASSDEFSTDAAPLLIVKLRLQLRLKISPHDVAMATKSQPFGGMN